MRVGGDTPMPVIMKQTRKQWVKVAIFFLFACISVHAQTVQFLPEIDAHLTLNSKVRVYVEAKDDREGATRSNLLLARAFSFI